MDTNPATPPSVLRAFVFPPRSQINPATKISWEQHSEEDLDFFGQNKQGNWEETTEGESVWLAQQLFSSKMKIGRRNFSQQVAHCWPTTLDMQYNQVATQAD